MNLKNLKNDSSIDYPVGNYDFAIEHSKGRLHANADAFSKKLVSKYPCNTCPDKRHKVRDFRECTNEFDDGKEVNRFLNTNT